MGEDTPLHTAAYYNDPFYAECRAYGCIQASIESGKLEEQVAAACYGYLLLSSEDKQAIQQFGIDLNPNDANPDFQKKN